ncbi:MAG: hypothetical protein H0V90_09230 [Blastocatellia bacterium]|nr:hypothetical protein [Blastocatellia bacterium]
MSDWIGLLFLVLLAVGVIVGLKLLSKPQTRTSEEFERNAAENTTMLGASMNALNEVMNPSAAKAKEVITQMKEGRYQKKKREGKAGGNFDETEGTEDAERSEPPAVAGG